MVWKICNVLFAQWTGKYGMESAQWEFWDFDSAEY